MFRALENSWKLVKGSLKLIFANPKLFVFPLLSFICFFLALISIIAIVAPAILMGGEEARQTLTVLVYIAVLFLMFIGPFFGTFFAVGLSYETGEVLRGHKVSLRRGFKHAFKNIGEVAMWAVTLFFINIVAAVLRRQAQRFGGAGRMIGNTLINVMLAGWSFATAFVVPIMAFEDTNPFHSIKKSVTLLKGTWGETLVGAVGAGSVLGLLIIPLTLLLFIPFVGIFFLPVFLIGVVIISLLTQVFNTVFMTSLYLYATDKDATKAEKYYDKDLILHGFY